MPVIRETDVVEGICEFYELDGLEARELYEHWIEDELQATDDYDAVEQPALSDYE